MDAQIFGYIGAALVAAIAVPQLVKILREREADGVSVPAWIMQALCCLTFLIYGLRIAQLPQVVGNVLPVAGALGVVAVTLIARKQLSTVVVVLSVLVTVVYVAAMFAIPPIAVGAMAAVWAFIARWPQVVDSIDSSRKGMATTVSPASWYLMIAAMSAWMVYGIMLGDIPVLATNVIGIVASIIILVAEYRNPARGIEVPAATDLAQELPDRMTPAPMLGAAVPVKD